MDLTLSNSNIGSYFNGTSDSPPIEELKYLHTHPLVKPNFLIEISNFAKANLSKYSKQELQLLSLSAIELGSLVTGLPDKGTEEICRILRDIYRIANKSC